jgi:transposase
LVVKDGGKWYVYLVYELTPEQSKADPKREAVLMMGSDNSLTLSFPDSKPWKIGNDEFLRVQLTRLIGLRKAMEFSTRFGQNRGHGRKRISALQSRNTRQQRHQMKAFRRKAIADIVKACNRKNCGTIVYNEPSIPLRTKSWFANEGIELDWFNFGPDLRYVAERNGLVFKSTTMKVAEWRENHATSLSVPAAVAK